MICRLCFEETGKEHELVHHKDVEAVHDPAANDGYGEREVCWLECKWCGHQEGCEGHVDEE